MERAINPINANLVNGEVVVEQVDETAEGWRGRVEQVDKLAEAARAEVARAYNQEFDDHNVLGVPPVVEEQMVNDDVDEQSVLNHNLLRNATLCQTNNFENAQGPHVWEGPIQRNIGIGMGLNPKVEDASKALKRAEKKKNKSYESLHQEFKLVAFVFLENGRLGKEPSNWSH